MKKIDTLSNIELQKLSILFQHILCSNLAKDLFN